MKWEKITEKNKKWNGIRNYILHNINASWPQQDSFISEFVDPEFYFWVWELHEIFAYKTPDYIIIEVKWMVLGLLLMSRSLSCPAHYYILVLSLLSSLSSSEHQSVFSMWTASGSQVCSWNPGTSGALVSCRTEPLLGSSPGAPDPFGFPWFSNIWPFART